MMDLHHQNSALENSLGYKIATPNKRDALSGEELLDSLVRLAARFEQDCNTHLQNINTSSDYANEAIRDYVLQSSTRNAGPILFNPFQGYATRRKISRQELSAIEGILTVDNKTEYEKALEHDEITAFPIFICARFDELGKYYSKKNLQDTIRHNDIMHKMPIAMQHAAAKLYEAYFKYRGFKEESEEKEGVLNLLKQNRIFFDHAQLCSNAYDRSFQDAFAYKDRYFIINRAEHSKANSIESQRKNASQLDRYNFHMIKLFFGEAIYRTDNAEECNAENNNSKNPSKKQSESKMKLLAYFVAKPWKEDVLYFQKPCSLKIF